MRYSVLNLGIMDREGLFIYPPAFFKTRLFLSVFVSPSEVLTWFEITGGAVKMCWYSGVPKGGSKDEHNRRLNYKAFQSRIVSNIKIFSDSKILFEFFFPNFFFGLKFF